MGDAAQLSPQLLMVCPTLDALPDLARLELDGPRLVFVDGRYAPEISSAGTAQEISGA